MLDKPTYSQLRAAPRLSLRDAAPIRAPFTLYVEPTNICNFKCVYCPESFDDFEEKTGGLARMDIAAFTTVAAQIRELGGVKSLNLYMMGEPLVNKALPDFVRIATGPGVADRVSITTNGSLLTEDAGRKLIDADLDYLRVSIYGGNAEAYARKTQSKVPLSRVRANVARFRALRDELNGRAFIYVKMIDSGDAAENAEFIEAFKDIADEVVIEPVMNWNDPEEGNLARVDRDSMLNSDYFRNRKTICPFPFYSLVIHSDLRVSVCCVDWAKEAVVGDLQHETIAKIWHGEKLRAFQLAHIDGKRSSLSACKNCTYLHTAPDSLDGLTREDFLARHAQRVHATP